MFSENLKVYTPDEGKKPCFKLIQILVTNYDL